MASTLTRCAVLFLFSMVVASVAGAGSICGTVRDAQTQQPVPRAAVFLFDDQNVYTGLYDDTDAQGAYCIDDVPDGTYALQVRVDDYLMAVVYDVVVEDATAVDIDAQATSFFFAPWPNPVSDRVFLRYRAPVGQSLVLEVFDPAGRVVKGWHGTGTGEVHTISWDLRDNHRREVSSGTYFIRMQSGAATFVRRFVRLR